MMVTKDSAVWTWGCNVNDQLGHNDWTGWLLLTRIPQAVFAGAKVVLVSNSKGRNLMAVSAEGILYSWGFSALGHGAQGLTASRVPVPVGASLICGSRCGCGCGLSQQFSLIFSMGTHAHLGRAPQAQGAVEDCIYQAVPDELLPRITEQAWVPTGAYARIDEGLLRLLAVRVWVTPVM